MLFISSPAFAYILIFILVYNVAKYLIGRSAFFNILLLLGSFLIVNLVVSIESGVLVLGLSCAVYGGGFLIHRYKSRAESFFLFLVSILIALFVIRNNQLIDVALPERIGLSYILFRYIHFLVDCKNNKIVKFDILGFLNYIIFFPTFLAGPIDRYNSFQYCLDQPRGSYNFQLAKIGVVRLGVGIVKKYLFVPHLVAFATDFSNFGGILDWQLSLVLSLVVYSFYILFDFSGYTDIAIGTAYLIGIKTPENFKWPYLSKNIAEFWKRWHITFSNFLFEYVFRPLVIRLGKVHQNSPRPLITSFGYFSTFVICGLWHGNSFNFLYWGLWHAIGLIIYKMWSLKNFGNAIRAWTSPFTSSVIPVVSTFLFVTFGWFFFSYKADEIKMIGGNLLYSNKDRVSLQLVRFDNKDEDMGFKMHFEAASKDTLVDIEYETGDESIIKMHDVPKAVDNNYYVLPHQNRGELHLVKIRDGSDKTAAWNIAFLRLSDLWTGSNVFAKMTAMLKMDSIGTRVLAEDRMELLEKYRNQRISAQSNYYEGYGWGIKMHYLASSFYNVEVQIKHQDWSQWIVYDDNRLGVYNWNDFHGLIPHNSVNRNLYPGRYSVRMRYKMGDKVSSWLEGYAEIPNYNAKLPLENVEK